MSQTLSPRDAVQANIKIDEALRIAKKTIHLLGVKSSKLSFVQMRRNEETPTPHWGVLYTISDRELKSCFLEIDATTGQLISAEVGPSKSTSDAPVKNGRSHEQFARQLIQQLGPHPKLTVSSIVGKELITVYFDALINDRKIFDNYGEHGICFSYWPQKKLVRSYKPSLLNIRIDPRLITLNTSDAAAIAKKVLDGDKQYERQREGWAQFGSLSQTNSVELGYVFSEDKKSVNQVWRSTTKVSFKSNNLVHEIGTKFLLIDAVTGKVVPYLDAEGRPR